MGKKGTQRREGGEPNQKKTELREEEKDRENAKRLMVYTER